MMKYSLLLIAFFLFIEPVCAEPQKIVLATFDQKAPRLVVSEMILQDIYKKLGIELKVVRHPGNRVLSLANSGKVDGVLIRADIIESLAENLVRIPYPIAQVKYAVYAKESKHIVVDGWSSLKPYKTGVLRGIKLTEERSRDLNRVTINSYTSLFKMLYLERIDTAIFTELDGLFALKAMNLQNDIKKIDPILEVSPSYHFLHKKHKVLISKLTKLMGEMDSSGELAALIYKSELTVAESLP